MRYRLLKLGFFAAFVLFSAGSSAASPILATQTGSSGEDRSGRLTGLVAAFQYNWRSQSVFDMDSDVTSAAAALSSTGPVEVDLDFTAAAAAHAQHGRYAPDAVGSLHEAEKNGSDNDVTGEVPPGQLVRDEVLTSLLDPNHPSADGLTQALSSSTPGPGSVPPGPPLTVPPVVTPPVVPPPHQDPVQVPEPSSLLLLGVGLTLATARRRRSQ